SACADKREVLWTDGIRPFRPIGNRCLEYYIFSDVKRQRGVHDSNAVVGERLIFESVGLKLNHLPRGQSGENSSSHHPGQGSPLHYLHLTSRAELFWGTGVTSEKVRPREHTGVRAAAMAVGGSRRVKEFTLAFPQQ